MFYEITYETGRVSVAEYVDEAEAQAALADHHRRALDGEPGGPIGQPAERIAKVRVYDVHPDNYNPTQLMDAEELSKEVLVLINALKDDKDLVDIARLAVEVRGLSHPLYTDREHPHDSIYRMQETAELEESAWAPVS